MSPHRASATPPGVVAYLRTHDGDRAKIAQEKAMVEAWAVRHGKTVVAWFIDAYESASTPPLDRATLRAALVSAIETRHALIIIRADRISRSPSQVAAIAALLRRYGASLKTIGHRYRRTPSRPVRR